MTLCCRISDSRFQMAADKCAPSLSEAIILRRGSRDWPKRTLKLCCSRTGGIASVCTDAVLSLTGA